MTTDLSYIYLTRQEPVICKHFGCGKHLTLNEQLAGDHCREHSGKIHQLVGHNDLKSALEKIINSKLK